MKRDSVPAIAPPVDPEWAAEIGLDLSDPGIRRLCDRTNGELTRWEPDRGEVIEIAGHLPLEPVQTALLRAIEEDPLFNH